MDILFVVPYAPNPVRVRPYEFIRTLLRRGHRVTVASLWTSEQERADLTVLESLGATIIAEPIRTPTSLLNSVRALFGPTPLQASYSWNPGLMARLGAALHAGRFDAVHVEHLRGSRYAVGVRNLLAGTPSNARPPIIWDSVDSISFLFEQAVKSSRTLRGRLITGVELERTRRHEAWLVRQFERTLVTSALDKAAFVGLLGEFAADDLQTLSNRIEVIANGVDLATFAFRDQTERRPARIIFSGKMSYHANVTAALHLVNDIMPLVWAQRPDADVWIVGREPTAEVRKLATNPAAGNGQRRVVVTGGVPSMAEYIQAAEIAVAPLLYGAGIQNKALEAMACGTPVVATHQATAALDVVSGRDLLIADGAEAFAAALLHLLADNTLRSRLGASGRCYVEQHHSWDAAAAALEVVYRTHPLA